jgi:hypothetical protein
MATSTNKSTTVTKPDTEPASPNSPNTDESASPSTICHVILYPAGHELDYRIFYASRCKVFFRPPLGKMAGDDLIIAADIDKTLEFFLDDSLDETVHWGTTPSGAGLTAEDVMSFVRKTAGPPLLRSLLREAATSESERLAVVPVFKVRMSDRRDSADPNFSSMGPPGMADEEGK